MWVSWAWHSCSWSFPYWERGLKCQYSTRSDISPASFPYWERGLKSVHSAGCWMTHQVVPLLGTWIEIIEYSRHDARHSRSFPYWERGLKSPKNCSWLQSSGRSLIGNVDWNRCFRERFQAHRVVPLLGTWIEIRRTARHTAARWQSFPYWERGLKWDKLVKRWSSTTVVPLLGTWIEIDMIAVLLFFLSCRSLIGNVDWNSQDLSQSCWFPSSFPYWERGLKCCNEELLVLATESFPYWVIMVIYKWPIRVVYFYPFLGK